MSTIRATIYMYDSANKRRRHSTHIVGGQFASKADALAWLNQVFFGADNAHTLDTAMVGMDATRIMVVDGCDSLLCYVTLTSAHNGACEAQRLTL